MAQALGSTVAECVKTWANTNPDTPAFIFVDPTWKRRVLSRSDVYYFAARYAAVLKRQGVQKGDIISNTLPNSPERAITDLGIIFAGAVAMNGQVLLKDGEDFFRGLKDSGSVAVILDPSAPRGAGHLLQSREKVIREDGTNLYSGLPALKKVFDVYLNAEDNSKALLEQLHNEQEEVCVNANPDDCAIVWTTSGSTGFSKLVPWSNRKLLSFFDKFAIGVGIDTGGSMFSSAPLGWGGGSLTNYIARGVTRVIPDLTQHSVTDVCEFMWDIICREKCTGAFVRASQMVGFAMNYSKKHQISEAGHTTQNGQRAEECSSRKEWKLKVIASGGQPLKKTHLAVLGTIADRVNVVYGSTEAGVMAWISITDAESYENCNNGLPSKDGQLKVVNDKMEEVPRGKLGEIICKSDQTFEGYLNNDSATEETMISDGWINTGDIGSMNKKGEVFVFCRKAFSIIRGPFLLYPGWLEMRMMKFPGVIELVIVPVPDPVLHQELCACIVANPDAKVTAQNFRQFCEDLFLTDRENEMTAVPKYFLFFDELPTTDTGKVCRRAIAALAVERLGLHGSSSGQN